MQYRDTCTSFVAMLQPCMHENREAAVLAVCAARGLYAWMRHQVATMPRIMDMDLAPFSTHAAVSHAARLTGIGEHASKGNPLAIKPWQRGGGNVELYEHVSWQHIWA